MDEGVLLSGRYRLVEVLGSGGMGRVWRAQDQLLDRPVAVKVLAPHLVDDERSSGRLRAEASRAAKVRHPNVVQVLDAVFEDDVAAIVLQLVEGPDLQAHVPAGGLAPEEALRLLDGVAAGLAAVHAAGVVHRDVTPRNVLLDAGVPRLTDFGIARSVVATSTATQTIRGSVGYLSPEQASGGEVGPAADVYALACLATFLLTGRPPFEAESPVGVVHQHLTATADDVRSRGADVAESVAAGIAAALAKEPGQRPPDVASFMTAIGRPLPATAAASVTAPLTGVGPDASAEEDRPGTRVLPGLATTRLVEPTPEPTQAVAADVTRMIDDAGAATATAAAAGAAPTAAPTAAAAGAAPTATGAVPAPVVEGADGPASGRGRGALVVGALAVLALVVALAASRGDTDTDPAVPVPTIAASPEPSVAPEPEPTAPPEPEPEPEPPTAEEAVAAAYDALSAALTEQRTAGGIGAEAFSKLDDKLGKVADKLREGEARDAEKELRSFREELTKRTDKDEVTPDSEAVLLAAAADLESALAGLQDTKTKGKRSDEDEDDGDD